MSAATPAMSTCTLDEIERAGYCLCEAGCDGAPAESTWILLIFLAFVAIAGAALVTKIIMRGL